MAAKMVFGYGGKQVAGWLREKGDVGKPITIYPNAHDASDSISIQWYKSLEDAEQLGLELLAAVKAVREAEAAAPAVTGTREAVEAPAVAEKGGIVVGEAR